MKIAFVWSYYEQFLDAFLAKSPTLRQLSYAAQVEMLVDQYFGVPGSYYRHAKTLGHEVAFIITNCRPIQSTWAKENGFHFDELNWERSIAAEQIRRLSPDIMFMGSMFNLYGEFLESIRPFCRRLIGWISCPTPSSVPLKQMSMILSSSHHLLGDFQAHGIRAEYHPAAFDADILGKIPTTGEQFDFSFVGGLSSAHSKRKTALEALAKATPLTIFGYQPTPGRKDRLLQHLRRDRLSNRHRGQAWGLDMYSILARSRITFNSHIDVLGDRRIGNMRMFEATGTGALMMVEAAPNLGDFFEDQKEVVAYSSIDDAIEKVRYLLGNEEKRAQIARAGQQRTLAQHGMQENVRRMIETFERAL